MINFSTAENNIKTILIATGRLTHYFSLGKQDIIRDSMKKYIIMI